MGCHEDEVRYWWVNHSQTMRQEVSGGYLWSPITEASGARSRFYDNMRRAVPGDVVLSYASGSLGRVGIVGDFAISAPKPEEFGSIGAYWNDTGWLLPIEWLDIQLAVRPKDFLSRLAPLLPSTHSPLQPLTGNGNQKAYLAEIGEAVVSLVFEIAGVSPLSITDPPTLTSADFATRLEDVLERQILEDDSIDQTIRDQLTRARRGQGLFRRRVMEIEPSCRITGVTQPNLLIASHVKPWRACATASERLDGFNGLMLAPHADFLFDRGLIGFEDDGRALFSSKLSDEDSFKLGLHSVQRPRPMPLREESRSYFQHHRLNVFVV